jgi:hypothetical protein
MPNGNPRRRVMNSDPVNTHIEAEIPEHLARQAQMLVKDGWARDINTLVVEALRRYCETHQGVLTETFLREDVRWGLNGES